MKSSKVTMRVERLVKMKKAKTLNFDLLIQRKDNIWDVNRKSMLIHSILTDFPIPPLYATKEGRVHNFIDGKQRLTSILSYIQNGFALDKTTASAVITITEETEEGTTERIETVELANKLFSELPEYVQKKMLNYDFDMYRLEDVTIQELEQLFFRLNNGMPLKQIETTRAILGGKVLSFVEDIAQTPFFLEKINVSKKSRQRFVDQELILQILSLIHNREAGVSGKDIQDFVKELRQTELQAELKTKIQNVCYYLNFAFPVKEKFLRKLHIPAMFLLVLENQEKAVEVSPEEFGKWSRSFFEALPQAYFETTQSGSAKKENVQKRIGVMKDSFQTFFKDQLNQKTTKPQDSLAYVMESMTKTNDEILEDVIGSVVPETVPPVEEKPEPTTPKAKRVSRTGKSKLQEVKEMEAEKEGSAVS